MKTELTAVLGSAVASRNTAMDSIIAGNETAHIWASIMDSLLVIAAVALEQLPEDPPEPKKATP